MKKIVWFFIALLIFMNCYSYDGNNLRFGVMNYYPPFIWKDSIGKIYGFDAAIAQQICTANNKRCIFVTMPFYQLFPSLVNNQVDAVISALTMTPKRKSLYDFSIPYFKSMMSFIAMTKTPINKTNPLNGKVIGTLKGSSFYMFLLINYPQNSLVAYDMMEQAIDALTKGEVDLILLDAMTANWWVSNNNKQYRIILTEPGPTGGDYGIAVKKGNTEVLNLINNGLRTMMTNGKYNEIITIYSTF